MATTIHKIELTPDEQQLFDSLEWNTDEFNRKDHVERGNLLENQYKLTESLIKRGAIPEIRRRWFTDAELNIAGRGKSRMDIFQSHGTTGDDIMRHQQFGPHLWYFIHGPNLPQSTLQGFCKIIDDDMGTSGELLDAVTQFVRSEVRAKRLDYKAPDEFTKLVNELDRPNLAEPVRSAAKAALNQR